MINEELKELVQCEALLLRRHLTETEKSRLTAAMLDAEERDMCIYGQATGHCDSVRAMELLEMCAGLPLTSIENITNADGDDPLVRDWTAYRVNDGYFRMHPEPDEDDEDARYVYSPIETYILQPEAYIEGLIAYLKCETHELLFEPKFLSVEESAKAIG